MFNMGILQGSISMHRVNKLMPKTFQEGLKQKKWCEFKVLWYHCMFQAMLKWPRKLYLGIEKLGTFLRN